MTVKYLYFSAQKEKCAISGEEFADATEHVAVLLQEYQEQLVELKDIKHEFLVHKNI